MKLDHLELHVKGASNATTPSYLRHLPSDVPVELSLAAKVRNPLQTLVSTFLHFQGCITLTLHYIQAVG